MSLSLIFLLLAVAMVAIHLVVASGALVSVAREPREPREPCVGGEPIAAPVGDPGAARVPAQPSVTVLVPARDEELLLPRLLASLEAQDADRFEVVLVNDRSADRTASIMAEFAERHPGRVRIVALTDDPEHGNPKQRALAAGAAEADGEVILMTDADCVVSPRWVRAMSRPFADERVGLVFGSVIPGIEGLARKERALDRFQAFDQVFRFQYTAGAAGLGAPSGGFGNNLAVRRRALDDAGGFAGLRFSPTEDAQLICQVRETGRWAIRALRSAGARVSPAPEESLVRLVRQSVRWNTGGLFAPDATARASYGVVMLYLFASVLLLPAALVLPPLALPALGSFTSMLSLGALAGALNGRSAGYWLRLPVHVGFAMLFYSYVTILTLARVSVSWKGRRLTP